MTRPIPAVPMPLGWTDVLAACAAGSAARPGFEAALLDYHGAEAAVAVSSARAAIWLALEALKAGQPGRTKVLLPGWTCPTVGRAVQAAGLHGVCVDISPDDFNIDAGQVARVIDNDTLAVIAAHMFGTPCRLDRLSETCRAAGAALIEDVAQACGAKFGGRLAGSFGELAVFSMGRGKNLRGAGGGALIVNDPALVDAVQARASGLPPGRSAPPGDVARQLAVSALSYPRAWQLMKALPFLRVGAEDQDFDSRPARLDQWLAGLGSRSLARVAGHNEIRARAGNQLEAEIADIPGLHIQRRDPPRESAWVRFAARLDSSAERRDAVVGRLQRGGVDARAFYSRAIYQYDWWSTHPSQEPCPVAESLVAQNLVLPLHFGMTDQLAREMARQLREALAA